MKLTTNNFTLSQILQTLSKFDNIYGKLGYVISKTKIDITKALQPFEQQRYKLFQKYGEQDKESGQLIIKPDSYKDFEKEFKIIAEDIQIEIDIPQVTREEVESNESLFENKNITVKDFEIIQTLFIKKQEQTKQQQSIKDNNN